MAKHTLKFLPLSYRNQSKSGFYMIMTRYLKYVWPFYNIIDKGVNTQLAFTCLVSNRNTNNMWNLFKVFIINFEQISDAIVDFEQVNASWFVWFVQQNVYLTGTHRMFESVSYNHLLKLQENSFLSTFAKVRITLLRIIYVVSPAIYFCCRLWTNASYGLN